MFTWIAIYEEAATALRAYRDRQPELVQILADMAAASLKATSVQERWASSTHGPKFGWRSINEIWRSLLQKV